MENQGERWDHLLGKLLRGPNTHSAVLVDWVGAVGPMVGRIHLPVVDRAWGCFRGFGGKGCEWKSRDVLAKTLV